MDYKILIVGSGGVGKSALTVQQVQKFFIEAYDPTIEASYNTVVNVDGVKCPLEIYDTSGQEEYVALRDQYIRGVEGYIIAYSITSRDTFAEVPEFHKQIARVRDEDEFPCVLIGTKFDLAESHRDVTKEEGEQLAAKLNCPFLETSAKAAHNVEQTFVQTVREIRANNPDKVAMQRKVDEELATAKPAGAGAGKKGKKQKKSGGCSIL